MARKHDETYKLIFSQRAAVEELIRNFVGEDLADELEWVAGAAEAWQIPEEEVVRMRMSMEDETMYERVKEMREQAHSAGVEVGLERGLEQGLEQGLERGLEQGLERGRAEGRALVERLATRKFGAETAEQLSRVLEDIADPERLAEVADAIIDCDSEVELFARVTG